MSQNTFTLPETMRINGLVDLKELITPLIESGGDLEFDGAAVSSLDTSGLQLIIAAHKNLAANGKKLTLKNPSEALEKALKICNAHSILNIA